MIIYMVIRNTLNHEDKNGPGVVSVKDAFSHGRGQSFLTISGGTWKPQRRCRGGTNVVCVCAVLWEIASRHMGGPGDTVTSGTGQLGCIGAVIGAFIW